MNSDKLKKILEFEDKAPNAKRQYITPNMEKYIIAPKNKAVTVYEQNKKAVPRAALQPASVHSKALQPASAHTTALQPASAHTTEPQPASAHTTEPQAAPMQTEAYYNAGEAQVKSGGKKASAASKPKKKHSRTATYIGRTCLSIGTAILFVIISVITAVCVIAYGPSETVRNMLVLSANVSSGAKWVPGLFLDDETVNEIIEGSKQVVIDDIDMDDYTEQIAPAIAELSADGGDMWASAKDGMIYTVYSGSTYKAYILLVKDASRIFTGVSSDDFSTAKSGMRIFELAEKYKAVAVINGGEFRDTGGLGNGAQPMGITYSKGEMVYSDGLTGRTFIGFDTDNKLVVREGMTKAKSEELKIRDGVCFQTGNVLIDNYDGTIKFHYADGDTSTAQRTAIGQCADGTVILIVTDGRTASSIGATRNDIINLMSSYGVVSAGMLDGGSSAMMYYRDYYTKYGIDTSELDEYQKQGLVNKYKAFTAPRPIPTYFTVAGE